jgi:acyl-CoA thioester hydrolase
MEPVSARPAMVDPLPDRRPWPVQRRFYIAYHDLDVLNHLNHAAYFPMMETLRCDYYVPLLDPPVPASLDIIIAEATCRYLAPVAYGSELLGEVAPARPLGRTSFVLLYRFRDLTTDQLTAQGRTVIVTYDYRTNAKSAIPSDRRSRLERDAIDPRDEGWPS